MRRFEVGMPREAERDEVVLSPTLAWSNEVSGVCKSMARVGRVVEECDAWWSDGGREGTKRSS